MKIFVYGTLMSGQRNHALIAHGKLIDDNAILGGYRMFSVGRYPAIAISTDDYKVVGEVWEIPDVDSIGLDRFEGVPFMYRRDIVPVFENGEIQMRMAYVWNQSTDNLTPIDSGVWSP